jgi:quercetin dioxygenase-like cupin family protein
MKTHLLLATAALIVATSLPLQAVQAQEVSLGDIKRIDLVRNDLSVPGREVIQALIEFGPGVSAARHSHPGDEVAYVTEGLVEYQLEGRPPVTLKAGESLFIPSGTPHSARNVGGGKAAELATYFVEKGKPLLALSK